jgi:recombination protein RecR
MIVARDSDFESVEKSGAYKGLYFILGGTVPIMDKEPEKRIRLKQLIGRITVSEESKGLSEVILSLNTTPDGENTEEIVKRAIESELDMKTGTAPIKVSVLGRGLSTGAELEYADQETIKNALKNRH